MKTVTKSPFFTGKIAVALILVLCSFITMSDTWIQKADYPFITCGSINFAIGGKGYIGAGESF